jgi:hypothetical protein
MPYAGDWYLWCLLALDYDVAYLAEPMVCYRLHDQSMTTTLTETNRRILTADDLAVLWRIRQQAESRGLVEVCGLLEAALSNKYEALSTDCTYRVSGREIQESLGVHAGESVGARGVGARISRRLADRMYWRGEQVAALELYTCSLRLSRWHIGSWIKYLLLRFGNSGVRLRYWLLLLRRGNVKRRVAQ